MNILPGALKDECLLIMGDFKLRLNKPLDLQGSVFIGIRPQHLELSRCEPGIKGRITSYEYLGDDVIIHVDITDLDVQALMPTRDLRNLVINQVIYLRPIDKIYIFNESSKDLVNIMEPNEYSHNYA